MSERCAITRYVCPADIQTIQQLATAANVQQTANSGFSKNIYPWKTLCEKGDYLHYIARDSTGIICGWLTATVKTFATQTSMYLVEIGTRRIKDALYGGVGQKLHNALLADASAMKCEFIYLYPLDAVAANIYKRPEWAYVQLRPDVPHLFRALTGLPSSHMLESLLPPGPNDILDRAKDIARNGNNFGLLRRIGETSSVVIKNPDALEQLEQHMDFMESMNTPLKKQRSELWDFFTKYLSKTGTR